MLSLASKSASASKVVNVKGNLIKHGKSASPPVQNQDDIRGVYYVKSCVKSAAGSKPG